MTRRALLVGLLGGAVVSGCSLMPPHEPVAPPIAGQWPAELVREPGPSEIPDGPTLTAAVPGLAARAVANELTEASWRTYFPEPGLHETIEAALAGNRDLAISLARIEEARAQAGLASAGLWPALDLAAQRNAFHTPATVSSNQGGGAGMANPARGDTHQRYDINLATSYELDFWGRVRSLDAAARANFMATDYAHQAFRLQLIGDVASAWYTLESWYRREYLLSAIESSRKATLALHEQRRDAGLSAEPEVANARAAYHAARVDHFNAVRQRALADNALRLLVGRDMEPGWLPPAVRVAQGLPLPAFPRIAEGVPAQAILRRPDVRAAEEKLRAARANIGAARASFLPKITLTASAGTASMALTDLFAAGSGAWTFLPVLRLPIFDAGRYRAELDIAKVREHIAVADYERTIQRAFREVADALVARPYGSVVVAELYNGADVQATRYQLAKARFAAGIANALELHEAERDMLVGQGNAAAARLAIQASAISFYKALGGL